MAVYCVHCAKLVEEWFRGGHACSLHVTYDMVSGTTLTKIQLFSHAD